MKKLLEAKHWHLFILIVGVQLIFVVIMAMVSLDSLRLYIKYQALIGGISIVIYFGWLWSIFIHFRYHIPEGTRSYDLLFKVSYFVAFSCIITSMIYTVIIGFPDESVQFQESDLIVWIDLLFIFLTIYCILCVARVINLVEVGRAVKPGEYLGDAFLIFFYPIGIWIIQPRINRVIAWISSAHDLGRDQQE